MPNLPEIEERVIANGRVDGHELEVLRRLLYADGKIGRKEADFLVELHKRVKYRTRAFEQCFYQAIKDHFHKDPADPDQYDLLLGAFRFPTAQCAELTATALQMLKGAARVQVPASPGAD